MEIKTDMKSVELLSRLIVELLKDNKSQQLNNLTNKRLNRKLYK